MLYSNDFIVSKVFYYIKLKDLHSSYLKTFDIINSKVNTLNIKILSMQFC